MPRSTFMLLSFFLFLCFVPQIVLSQQQKGRGEAIENVSALKAYFDIKADSAAKIVQRPKWINAIYEQMRQKGEKPAFIIAFRSQASFYVVRGDEDIDEDEIPLKRKIENRLKHFVQLGIPVEQCGLSAELYDINPSDFLPDVTTVTNGYISMIKYQNRGYAYVPM